MNFDLLSNADIGVYLADCRVTPDRIQAWWVYCNPGLPETVELKHDRSSYKVLVRIPDDVRGLSYPLVQFFETEPVEFLYA